jgi:hypothetical protein
MANHNTVKSDVLSSALMRYTRDYTVIPDITNNSVKILDMKTEKQNTVLVIITNSTIHLKDPNVKKVSICLTEYRSITGVQMPVYKVSIETPTLKTLINNGDNELSTFNFIVLTVLALLCIIGSLILLFKNTRRVEG